MKNSVRNALCAVTVGLAAHASSQGTFQNLNFEQAAAPGAPTPVGGWGDSVDPALAFPGWTVGPTNHGIYSAVTVYNDLSLGAPAVCLMGPNFPNAAGYSALQGSYSVLLQYFGIGPDYAPRLSQTGLVPADARSISFLVGRSDITVSLGGVNIPLVQVAGGRLAGDVTAFAGSTVQLTFSTTADNPPGQGDWAYFDDVVFSSSPIPEPGTLVLLMLGFVLLGGRIVGRAKDRVHEAAA
jgi:hypothetical protein